MGTESFFRPYTILVDGQEFEVERGEISTFDSSCEIDAYETPNKLCAPSSFKMKIENPEMSKKKLVKRLMSRGLQRNEANVLAKFIYCRFGEYNTLPLMMSGLL